MAVIEDEINHDNPNQVITTVDALLDSRPIE
ncbi:MAG: hypothetical protein ACJA0C_000093 [Candidatus Endobugula sp.]